MNNLTTRLVNIFLLSAGLPAFAGSPADRMPDAIAKNAQPFPLEQVRLLDGPFKENMERDRKYILELEPDRLLHTFRLTAGLPTNAKPYGGWENPGGELRGHTLGHYLSALSLMYASTGESEFKKRTDYIVAELAKCQAAMPSKGYNAGFLSAYPESFFDRVDAGKPVWAPYYTLHKIFAGLLDAYKYCGNSEALEVVNKMADWLKMRVDRLGHEQHQKALKNEHGGMNESFANLYAITGNPDHLRLARAFNHEEILEPLAKGEDRLDGKHANTQIPKVIGAAREYELTGEAPFKAMSENFWKFVVNDRSYCIGGHSDHEHFFPISKFAEHLSPETAETCNTYNMLKLSRHLFTWEPSAPLMDYCETALFNHILGSQDPKTGMMLYFASLKPGHFKVFNTPDNSFWCCTGTGMENHAKYADLIYFHSADSLYVNLFIASELDWSEKGLKLKQETRFPEVDSTKLTISCEKPLKLALKIRYPVWATSGCTLSLNGTPQKIDSKPGEFITLEREWKNGDIVEIQFPMSLQLKKLPGVSDTVAFMYGPIVLAGKLGKEGMDRIDVYRRAQTELSKSPTPFIPALVCDASTILSNIVKVNGESLTFRTQGVGRPEEITLVPFSRIHDERYSVYWKLYSEADWKKHEAAIRAEAEKRRAFEARILDEVQPGEQQPETDHNMKTGESRTGEVYNRKWRDAGDWFSYEMRVGGDQPLELVCTYWGRETGARQFDILVDGRKIATENLGGGRLNEFIQKSYVISADLIHGKDKVTITFQAQSGNRAGGIFGITMLKPKP